ncbi:GNAT family N-acetyltransferase [Lentzea tibetensis]|uniref:GNAT family N-acetyltransferase n=1 Tax=Lentzea tibetensis TaxID=2591470 RepID=A0A563EVS8_9PSEU|nr:GNAT family N-acetyltransferase [Lentzea tibetensis]TWP51581.1 GNAT family N-acetyltransferase [Lentzea tibetensis]
MDPWPLRHLVIRTPRLELRPDDDAGLLELAELAAEGIHPSDEMPFAVAWTDAPPSELGLRMLQYYWAQRAALTSADWSVNFLIRIDGKVIGTQGLSALNFKVLQEVSSGSWLGRRYQGNGYGTEMRAAVLLFAFDHLGAVIARSAAWEKNAASNRVSEKLGYTREGTHRLAPRGEPLTHIYLRLDENRFQRPSWQVTVEGLADCVHLLTG